MPEHRDKTHTNANTWFICILGMDNKLHTNNRCNLHIIESLARLSYHPTSSYTAFIHSASQSRAFFTTETRTTLSGNSSFCRRQFLPSVHGDFLTHSYQVRLHIFPGCAGGGCTRTSPNSGSAHHHSLTKGSSSYCRIQRGPRRNAGFSAVT